MSKKENEDFGAWVEEVIGSFPADKQDLAREVLNSDVSRDRFFRGTIRQDDYYRRLNELNEERKELESTKDELASFYEEQLADQEALIAERDLLKAKLAERSGDPPPAAGIPGFSTEDLAALKAKADKIDALDKIMPAVMADMAAVQYDAIKNNFDYDPREVMRLSLQHGTEPYKAYEYLTKDQRQNRYEEAQKKERDKWIEEGRRQALSAKNGSPDQLPHSGPSVFDRLQGKDTPESTHQSRVAAALQGMLEVGPNGEGLS